MLASCLGLIVIGLMETVFNIIITKISGVTIEQALAHPLWRILFPLPEFVVLIIVIMILAYYNLALFNIEELSNLEPGEGHEKQ